MRFISTYAHGFADYIMGAFLIIAPWIFGFSNVPAATWVMVVIGAGVIVYSLFTDYELGMVRKIPMTAHLGLDFVGGLVLAISPWLFGFYELVYLPHLILGLLEMGAAVMTQTVPGVRRVDTTHHRHVGRTAPDAGVDRGDDYGERRV